MTTLIELFDRSPVENLLATLALRPDRTVYLGTDMRRITRQLPVYEEILRGRGIKTELSCRSAAKNDLDSTLNAIDSILDECSDEEGEICIVDMSGGDETLLLSVGIILGARAGQGRRLLAFRCSPLTRMGSFFLVRRGKNGKLVVAREQMDFSSTGENPLSLSVDEIVTLHGGKITARNDRVLPGSAEAADIDALWELCTEDCAAWNATVNRFSTDVSKYAAGDGLYSIPETAFGKGKNKLDQSFFKSLCRKGLIHLDPFGDSGVFLFRYKNKIVKECLTKSGSVLEYMTLKTAMSVVENGRPLYDSAETGVILDWDGQSNGTRNEIDVILTRGVTPVFISCKNGDVGVDELYKVAAVADRFGGDFSRRAILATSYFDPKSKAYPGPSAVNNVEDRARDMGIRTVEQPHKMSEEEFAAALAKLVK